MPVAWIVARAAGLVAFALLTLSVWLGLGMSTRLLGPTRQKSLFGWHRTLVWTGLSMLALHVSAVLLDPVLHLGLAAATVPFAATWRPAAIAAGVLAGWLSVMLAVSFRLRKRIGPRGWRRLHYASFASFVRSWDSSSPSIGSGVSIPCATFSLGSLINFVLRRMPASAE